MCVVGRVLAMEFRNSGCAVWFIHLSCSTRKDGGIFLLRLSSSR